MRDDVEAARPVLVLSTVGTEGDAVRIAHAVVDLRLAACVNVLPGVRSIYRWQGAVEDERELLLIVKTTRGRQAELLEALRAAHPYEVPELVVLDPAHVAEPYARWLADAVRPA